ncbi:MAG TPA: hypothetical protein VKT76_15190 [Bradyrhizobium sp.]|nr:hypothetical protein [Bradyrhizobium sp.]
MIVTIATEATNILASLGWQLQRVDQEGRGRAIFTDGEERQLIIEIGLWYPHAAHHLDDQPGIVLCYQEPRMPKILIPYQGSDQAPNLRWSSTPDEIAHATHAAIGDFVSAFLRRVPDKRTLYNHILDSWLKAHGVLEATLVQALRDAFAEDSATSVAWAEHRLAILRERLRGGASVRAFDPATKGFRTINTADQFDGYVASSFATVRRSG